MAYRRAEQPEEPVDGEAVAIAELARRAKQVRTRILVPGILGSLLAGVGLALVIREAQLIVIHAHFPYATALMVAPAVAWAMRRSAKLADRAIALRAPAWRTELAEQHGLDLGSLTELTEFL